MSENKFLKGACTQCGGHLEFPADGIGSTIPCPHCGWQTELTLAAPEETSARSPRRLKWAIAGAVILLIGMVGGVGALLTARHLVRKRAATQAAVRAASEDRTASATPAKEPATVINGFSFSAVQIQKTPGSTLVHAVGTAKNETGQQRFNVTVEVDLFDSAGKKIGTAKDYKDAVEPRTEWTFRALLLQPAVVAARVAAVREQQ